MVSQQRRWSILFSLTGMLLGAGALPRTLSTAPAAAFSLRDAAADGKLAWGPEDHVAVSVASGQFSVSLGDTMDQPTTALAGSRWRRGAPGQEFPVAGATVGGISWGHNLGVQSDDGATLPVGDIFQSGNNGNYNVPWAKMRPVNMSGCGSLA